MGAQAFLAQGHLVRHSFSFSMELGNFNSPTAMFSVYLFPRVTFSNARAIDAASLEEPRSGAESKSGLANATNPDMAPSPKLQYFTCTTEFERLAKFVNPLYYMERLTMSQVVI